MIEQAMSLANSSCNALISAYEGEEETARGLEFYSIEGSRRRKLNRIKAVIAVLREQKRQQESTDAVSSSDELIERACLEVSGHCQEEAYIQGVKDEEEVFPQKPRSTKLDPPKPGMFSCFTQLVRDISDIGHVEWAAQ